MLCAYQQAAPRRFCGRTNEVCARRQCKYFQSTLRKPDYLQNMSLLSVCIATMNRAQFIGKTLDSILLQATEDVEVVVVDGASTDNTEQVVHEYQAQFSRLRYLRLPINGGFDQDYNQAVEFAQGDYCWLMSDDDILKPGAIATVLQAIRDDHDLIVVNWEVWNQDFTKLLLSHVFSLWDARSSRHDKSVSMVANYGPYLLPLPPDRLYQPEESQSLFVDMAMALSFISIVVIKRRVWMNRDRASYFGTLFVHVGVIFQAPLTGTTLFIAQPQVATRYGNASWMSQHFEIWMFKWPNLIWSFSEFTEAAKHQISPREPWHNLKDLLMNRAIGVFSNKEYSHWLLPRLKSRRERFTTYLIAQLPGWIVNLLYVATISLLRLNGGFLLADLKNSPFYYRTYFDHVLDKSSSESNLAGRHNSGAAT
jgi:abequosyltransferase